MNPVDGRTDAARERDDRAKNADALGEAARRLPDVVEGVDRLQAAWKVLMSPRTPRWKRIVVALEVARLVLIKRFRNTAPIPALEKESIADPGPEPRK